MAASAFTYYPPGSASATGFDTITDGFVLTHDVTMLDAKTLATTLAGHQVPTVQWRHILNNATSTRPKSCGGPTIEPLANLMAYHPVGDLQGNLAPLVAPGSARAHEVAGCLNACPSAWWCAILDLPNSFAMDDQRVLKVAAAAAKSTDAMQKVCLLAFTHLLLRGPTLVLLRSNHWNVDVTVVQQAAVRISGVQPPASGSGMTIAPAPPPRSQNAYLYYEPPAEGQEQERDDLICQILSDMISESPSGWVRPYATKGGWRLLRRYVPPGGLAKFIREHNQFQMARMTSTTWAFSFVEQDLGDLPDTHAPVSDSVEEREIRVHRCDHGEWQRRSARPLCPGHVLAEFDLIPQPPNDVPACCLPQPREEIYNERTGKWMVWCVEQVEFVHEDVFYMSLNE